MSSKVAALPVEASGDYETSRFNALKHGLLSRYVVLPWEDETEYRTLVASIAAEHTPIGPTEEYCTVDLVAIRLLGKSEGSHKRCASPARP